MTVGAPVRATDDINNALNYTLGDANDNDNDKFEIDQKTGQIKTLWDLDRDVMPEATATTAGNCAIANSCVVQVTATDSAGLASTTPATVTITLKNVDEKPEFTETSTALSPKAIMTPEESTALFDRDRTTGGFVTMAADVTYAATDEDGLNVNLSLMGPDGDKFSLGTGGVLSFKEKPDYEMPADANRDNVYEVTVRASDGTMYADRMVRVTVADANEAPMILGFGLNVSGSRSVEYPENGTVPVGTYTASGPEAASARWKLEGDDAGDFRFSSSSGMSTMLMFSSSPNYEMPRDADTDNTYMVTLKANDGENMDTHDVTVMVTNMKEDGTVMLSSMTPVVGVELTASLTDLDGGISDVTWTWDTSSDMSTWADGSGTATTSMDMMKSTYTPVMADDGMYLRATATYTDDYGEDTAMAKTTAAVTAGDPLVIRYDTNPENGMIEKSEVITAINEYLDAGADAPSKADVIRLINLYLDG